MDRKQSILAALMLVATAMLAARAQQPGATRNSIVNSDRQNFAGDAACQSCHQEKLESYLHTAHHLTSRSADQNSILGSFAPGKNILKTADPALSFRMEAKPEGFFQSSVWEIPPVSSVHTERLDVVIGSGRKGQTYLYWKGDRLFQLPVSYWVELGNWINSPGYRDGTADFDRPVIPRCLECHATYAEAIGWPTTPNEYKRASIVDGISCERCHGPGRGHVEAMAAKSSSAGGIVNPAKLERDRRVEVCAQCHGGLGTSVKPPFSFVPGQALDGYLQRDVPGPAATVDVHGNQIALLQRSRCYQSAAAMTCSTCHDVHTPQRDALAFSSRCLTCHKVESCGLHAKLGEQIASRCVDCHMPIQQSNLIVSDSNGKQVRAKVRSHWIKVYPELQTLEAR
jgi:hypothetical protein